MSGVVLTIFLLHASALADDAPVLAWIQQLSTAASSGNASLIASLASSNITVVHPFGSKASVGPVVFAKALTDMSAVFDSCSAQALSAVVNVDGKLAGGSSASFLLLLAGGLPNGCTLNWKVSVIVGFDKNFKASSWQSIWNEAAISKRIAEKC